MRLMREGSACAMRGVWRLVVGVVQGDVVSRERGCAGSVGCVKAVPYKGNKKSLEKPNKGRIFFLNGKYYILQYYM